MTGWITLLHGLAIVLAIGGGAAGTLAYMMGQREQRNGVAPARRSHITYLISYILMSLSIFFVALGGLVG